MKIVCGRCVEGSTISEVNQRLPDEDSLWTLCGRQYH